MTLKKRTNQKKRKPPKPVRKNNEKQLSSKEAAFLQLWPELEKQLGTCLDSEHFMIALFHLNGTDIQLWRKTADWLSQDFMDTVVLLAKSLKKEQTKMESRSNPIPLVQLQRMLELVKDGTPFDIVPSSAGAQNPM